MSRNRSNLVGGVVRKLNNLFLSPRSRFLYLTRLGVYNHLSDEEFIQKKHQIFEGRKLDLQSPKTFNEKINWLMLHDRKPEYSLMVDKYEAKCFISKLLGNEYIIETLGIYKSFDEINFDELPEQFVLKCTHDSGGVVVCRSKQALDLQSMKKFFEKRLKRNYYSSSREWPYKDVTPRILAEKYMQQEGDLSLTDYKYFCFNGEPRLLYVSRGLEHHPTAEISFYDMNGKETQFHRRDYKPYHNAPMPHTFDKMKECAKIIAQEVGSPFSRIDLYSIDSKIYFSEITFSPCAGMIPFDPETADEDLGKLLRLPN